jgi:CRISPR type III-A-associated RAMP protein Csm4
VIAYRLSFEGPLRVGDGSPFPRSDALAAALCEALAALGHDASRIAADPPFSVSSAFPWATARGGGPLYLLPRPLGSRLDRPMTAELRAEQRRVRWLSPALFAWSLGGEPTSESTVAQDGQVWTDVELPPRLWTVRERARRPFDRQTGLPAGAAVRSRELVFAEGAGLTVVARYRDRGVRARVEAALRLLADEGLTRSAPFRFEVDESFQVPSPARGGWVLLSLYHPTPEEVERGVLAGGRYAFALRGGTHASGARRRAVRMLVEGSRLRDVGGAPRGAAVRVLAAGEAPGLAHDVYRSGVALCAPAPGVGP